MIGSDLLGAVHVGDGPRHLPDSIVAAAAEGEALGRRGQQAHAGSIQPARR